MFIPWIKSGLFVFWTVLVLNFMLTQGNSVPILQDEQIEVARDFKQIAQGHSASKWWSQDFFCVCGCVGS